jgi:hypothetical protein
MDVNKVSFDVDCKGTQAFFQLNVRERFAMHMLPDFEIVSFPRRVTLRDRTPEPMIVCKLQLASMMESEELSIFQKHEAAAVLLSTRSSLLEKRRGLLMWGISYTFLLLTRNLFWQAQPLLKGGC